MELALAVLQLDEAIQPRVEMSKAVIRDYALLYREAPDVLPPIVVFQEQEQYWVADGFHRVLSAQEAGLTDIPAEVRQGRRREAMLYACGCNKHGLQRGNKDKQQVVTRMLEDAEWQQWSDSAIARHCGVTQPTVAKYRRDMELSSKILKIAQVNTRLVERNGSVYPMQTAQIGIREQEETDGRSEMVPSTELLQVTAPALILTRQEVATAERPISKFNQVNEQIDWAKWSWNPVTGCLHTCVYCYARDIAERFYPEKFAPTFRPERLSAPHHTQVPAKAATDIGWRNVFVCSMADLFGKWVPDAWIDAVLTEVRQAPQWNFLFLTKFPQRLAEIDWPRNAWVGTTVDEQYRVSIAEKAFRKVNAPVKWLSCEPLRERLTFSSLEMFDWVVFGGQSESSKAPAFQPPWEWVEHLQQQARAAKCLVYWKPNLLTRPQEYPTQEVRL